MQHAVFPSGLFFCWDFPGSSVGKKCLPCRRPRLDPWVRKIPWRRKWKTTPVSFPRNIQWKEKPGGLRSMGSQSQTLLSNFHSIFIAAVIGATSKMGKGTPLHFVKFVVSKHSNIVQFSSVAQSCPTLCDPMNHSTPGLPVHHQLPEFTQTQVLRTVT